MRINFLKTASDMGTKKMDLFGIKFVPFDTPIHRRIQTLSAFLTTMQLPILLTAGGLLTAYMFFYTKYWIICIAYHIWIWVIDTDAAERRTKSKIYFRDLQLYKYAKDYYPVNLKIEEGVTLDAKRNYMFTVFPHGVIATGPFITLATNACGFKDLFPYHVLHPCTLSSNFKWPLLREYLIFSGFRSVSAKSISSLLNHPGGGRIAALVVGGAEEGLYARPGPYHLVLKNRKGFIKLALKNGSPLVPVFSFGETEIFDQVSNPEGSLLRRYQTWIKNATGVAPALFFGRGFLQYTFGFVPRRKPITVVVGIPMEVQQNDNPTQEDIDALHSKFIKALTALFDNHKHKYIDNPEHAILIVC